MIILTGGAGFIGSCFLKLLNENGIKDIIVVDNLGTSSKWKNLVGKHFSKYIHKNNFFEEIISIPNLKIEAIFHFGACSSTTENDIDYLIKNNFDFSMKLARFAQSNQAQFIYASSAATYGNGEFGYDDNRFQDLRPLNGYGYSKHLFDLWVIANKLETEFTGLKFFNVYGPNEYHKNEMTSMIFKSYYQIEEYDKIRLFKSNHPDYKDGEQLRDFVYVKDVIQVIWEIYEKNIKGIYNLGTGHARTWKDLAKAVFDALNEKPVIEYFNMPESLQSQYQNYTQAEMKKLSDAGINLNFRTLEEGVEDYINNHLVKDYPYF
ncbi:MAG: ADP-glyceromanno-heptose 6-epimerase [Ignavibacteria bacterium GWF2_33_9]|nr:MAG: ADP-glyceromanno-heptose 6-epimerase [Ignavibacteria bacterium GWF2_33_9]